MLIRVRPNSSSIYILEPGQLDRENGAAGRSTQENTREHGLRVVSTVGEAATEGRVLSQRIPGGTGWATDLDSQ